MIIKPLSGSFIQTVEMDAEYSRGRQQVQLALAKNYNNEQLQTSEDISMLNAKTFLRIQEKNLQHFHEQKSCSFECNESDNFASDAESDKNDCDVDDSAKD